RNHWAAREKVRAEPLILPAEFRGIEYAADIIPGECAHEPFLTVAHLLPANFQRKRKLLVIADGDIGLVQVDHVRLGAVALGFERVRHSRIVGVSKTFVALL